MYCVHVWKSCGMKMENVRFIWASDFIEQNATEPLSCHTNHGRTIMGHVHDRYDRVKRGSMTSLWLEKSAVPRSVARICQENFRPYPKNCPRHSPQLKQQVSDEFLRHPHLPLDLSIPKGNPTTVSRVLILERTV